MVGTQNQKEMACFPCISGGRRRLHYQQHHEDDDEDHDAEGFFNSPSPPPSPDHENGIKCSDDNKKVAHKISSNGARSFTLTELAAATKNFRVSYLIGEGGFGKVYKGILNNGQVVAVKRLNLEGLQGNQEFIIEVLLLSLLHHPNLVNLIGYCAEGDQRLLVYEYMPNGSLQDHLFDNQDDKDVLEWNTRVKIAAGAARGLEYLHCEAKPPIIYRDLKSANILLDRDFSPRLSDFGLAKLGPIGDKTHVSTRVMGTFGYCAPEYAMTGKLTLKSDIFSFGVVLLELVTGKKTIDIKRIEGERSLVAWSRPFLKDRRRYMELVDPRLRGRYSRRSARHLIAVAAMCLSEEAAERPTIKEIVAALDFLASECNAATANTPSDPGSSPLQL